MIIKNVKKLFTKADAIKVAAEIQVDDEEWAYTPVHDPKGTGWSFIEIYDEDGFLVGQV
jgi:hypothetical protein